MDKFSDLSKYIYFYKRKLFTKSSKVTTGFNDWKNVNTVLREHKCSDSHINATLGLQKRYSIVGCVDTELA